MGDLPAADLGTNAPLHGVNAENLVCDTMKQGCFRNLDRVILTQ